MTRKEEKVWHEIVATLMKIHADTEIVITSINRITDFSHNSPPHLPKGLPYTCNIGPIELHRTADLIKSMIYKPEDDKANTRAQKGTVMGETNRNPPIWVCNGCFTVITNMEYEHFNQTGSCDGCCRECGNTLYQYKEVE